MIWALVDNDKKEPSPRTKGICPICEGKVFSKCGEIKVWHWAHAKGENCDTWYEPETFWHKNWKLAFGKENTEVAIKKEGKRHMADVFTNKKVVIEFQNSPISKSTIREREEFYGERMLWVINGSEFKRNFILRDEGYFPHWWGYEHDQTKNKVGKKFFKWSPPRRSWEDVKRPVFIDFGGENLFRIKRGMGVSLGYGRFVSKEDFLNKYNGNFEIYSKEIKEYEEKIQQVFNKGMNHMFPRF